MNPSVLMSHLAIEKKTHLHYIDYGLSSIEFAITAHYL